MAGLYIHVPFCASRCTYCNFYSTTQGEEMRHLYVAALREELKARRDFLPAYHLSSIYFGGGTPSQLSPDELATIFDAITHYYIIDDRAEITLEANPDDVTPAYADALSSLPVNRVSLGCQSSDNQMLRLLNRRHTFEQATAAVELLRKNVSSNISIDLMYGLPHQSLEMFRKDIEQVLSLPVTHLSAYALSIERGTALWKQQQRGDFSEADEELSRAMYEELIDRTTAAGFEHYEISNFARPGKRAVHNSSYWKGEPYLGCGPGAHSYNGGIRRWNTGNLAEYVNRPGQPPYEQEVLSVADRYNDYIMTSLRTCEGLDLNFIEEHFGASFRRYAETCAALSLKQVHLCQTGQQIRLTRSGLFISDDVISDLFFVE